MCVWSYLKTGWRDKVLTDKIVPNHHTSPFESAKQFDENGNEFWSARDLMVILEYLSFRNFKPVIEKAIAACDNSNYSSEDHFAEVRKMVPTGSGASRAINDYHLSRYACYLIIQNADPSKEMVALGQSYFAIQTRKQELFEQANDDEKRLMLRDEMRRHNTALVAAAQESGVETSMDFAIFQNHGYKGLYGLYAKEIKVKKGLKQRDQILDHMGTTELAANLFRATQTEEKLRRDKIRGKDEANRTHYQVGQKVRKAIADIGGTMPEELPAEENINTVAKRLKKDEKKRMK